MLHIDFMITLVPTGGLCNRMRAIDSAVALCEKINRKLRIIWYMYEGLNCSFFELFQPINNDYIKTIDIPAYLPVRYYKVQSRNELIDKKVKEINIIENMKIIISYFIPKIYQKLMFDKVLYEDKVIELYNNGFDFESLSSYKRIYMISCHRFFNSYIMRVRF